jgi:hypothetical protein
MGTNIALDLPLMLLPSPMQMALAEYGADIGLTYAMIPIITMGIGIVRAQGGPTKLRAGIPTQIDTV